MTKCIFRSVFLAAFAVFIACLVLVMGALYSYFSARQESQLAIEAKLAAAGVESGGEAYLENFGRQDGLRLTWIDSDGTVLYDTNADASSMENHADREEVAQALQTGSGEGKRVSATLSEKTVYIALRLSDGTVLRAAASHYTVPTLLLGILQPLIVIVVLAVILSALLASRLSKRIVGPLNAIDLDHPLENDTYDELSPLLTRVERQQRQIRSQLDELTRRRRELEAVTSSMSEGLILLDAEGGILSINPAAKKVFGADDEIYNAILWHTTGKPGMTVLEKVLYLAAYIEPNRDFDGVEELRKVVWEDIDRGLAMGLAMTVEEMEERGNPVHHNTLEALDELRGHSHE